jgi:hypothetical protein
MRRIQLNGKGKMDELLDVDDPGTPDHLDIPPNSSGSEITIPERFTRVTIVCQDSIGAPFSQTFSAWTNVEISSALSQNVKASKVAGGASLVLMAFGAIDPIIEGKSHKRKRRYVVANSGPIEQIQIDGNTVYVAQNGFVAAFNPPLTVPAPQPRMVYTSVVIT